MKNLWIPAGILSHGLLCAGCGPAAVNSETGQTLISAEDNPAIVGFSAPRLERMDELFQDYVDQGYIAGASAITAKNRKIVHHRAQGA